ncbi:putative Late nodulin [Medicago truncatula]|uniref:Nodule Cysteine-Rich (NCR) secreted peptide n=1 Tax=Medicago truncatula TaxID=3880 RepID=A0A072UI83_MEDTR|nr:Nodule Cysteine-Rich (NCR) secreted peptide [Medicago truncatula]RHN59788.1 putative Late nodulin [Medicago truncatula]
MGEILKFVYNVILFGSLYLLVIYAERECDTDADCQKKFPGSNQHLLWCNNGFCDCRTH